VGGLRHHRDPDRRRLHEARFNWNVAVYLRADLTRKGLNGLGPCVDTRARILNRAHANVSIDIQADYGPRSGRGFTVLEPVADGPNNKANLARRP
jgi:N-acetylmuramoyl-L-alanine amidase